MKKVLVTGGAGYIGSTVVTRLREEGYWTVVLDDLSTGLRSFAEGSPLYVGDVGDRQLLREVFKEHPDIRCVVHCAARVSVPDSVADPVGYFDNNVSKGLTLLEEMDGLPGKPRLVFASSAAVYGNPENGELWVDEDSPVAPASPYAQTKAIFDQSLSLACWSGWGRAVSLRFFNPVGSDPAFRSGLPSQDPGHVLGRIITAWRTKTPFTITGLDWPTPDGTGLRDYIHVWDLARGVVKAVRFVEEGMDDGRPHEVINLGAGNLVTVKDLLHAFRVVAGGVPEILDAPARPGDVAGACTRFERAADLLDWKPEKSLHDGIRDALAWDLKHRPSL